MPRGSKKGKNVPNPCSASGGVEVDPRNWDGPFRARSTVEIALYNKLSKRDIAEPRFFDMAQIEEAALAYPQSATNAVAIYKTATYFGCSKLATLHGPSSRDLVLEFYSTFAKDGSKFSCRLGGNELVVDEDMYSQVLGLSMEGERVPIDSSIPDLTLDAYWKKIARVEKGTERYLAWDIKEETLFHTYKFISHILFGKQEATKCSHLEISFLWFMGQGRKPSIPHLIMDTILHNLANSRIKLTYGPIIIALAEEVGVDVRDPQFTFIKARYVKLAPRALRISSRKRGIRRPNVGESSNAQEEPDDEDTTPLESLAEVKEEIRALRKEMRDQAEENKLYHNRSFEAMTSLMERQSRHRKRDHKEHKSILDFLKSCACMSKDAVKDIGEAGVDEQADAAWVEDMNRAGGLKATSEGIEPETQQGGDEMVYDGGQETVPYEAPMNVDTGIRQYQRRGKAKMDESTSQWTDPETFLMQPHRQSGDDFIDAMQWEGDDPGV